jgi:hypothetical protein
VDAIGTRIGLGVPLIATFDESKALAEEDAIRLRNKPLRFNGKRITVEMASYAEENTLAYYLLVNTWGTLVNEYAPHALPTFVDVLTSEGLLALIKKCQDEADRVVRELPLSYLGEVILHDLKWTMPRVNEELNTTMIGRDITATLLFLLRYPKRFSPKGQEVAEYEALIDFVRCEQRTRNMARTTTYAQSVLLRDLRHEIAEMYDWDALCDKIEAIIPSTLTFSTGASIDADANLGSKVTSALGKGWLDYQESIFGVYLLPRSGYVDPMRERTCAKVAAVPKSYKAARIIAMEDSTRLAIGKKVEEFFREQDRTRHTLNIQDQTINQRLAQSGSVTGDLATVDAEHASDLIPKGLWRSCFPSRYVRLVDWLISDEVYIEKLDYRRPMEMASTAGHTLTFRHESIVYKAGGKVGAKLHAALVPDDGQLPFSWAFGDDLIVNSHAYDSVVYVLTRLGLKINGSKSFATGSYRESCGKDYIDGVDVTSVYFPRFPIIGEVTANGKISLGSHTYRDEYRGKLQNSFSMLVDLEKKLYPLSYNAAQVVAQVVRKAYPSVTQSVPGTVCEDLWGPVDTGKIPAPQAFRVIGHAPHWKVQVNGPASYTEKIGLAADTLSDDGREVFQKLVALDSVHTSLRASRRAKKLPKEAYAVHEYYKYMHFLQFGPSYSDPLMRLLGISDKPVTPEGFFGVFELRVIKS